MRIQDQVRARWIPPMTFEGGELKVALPLILDHINARVIRKLVLSRLPECLSICFDAGSLNNLGEMGSRVLWQMVTIAKKHKIHVEITNVTQHVHDLLLKVKEGESIRRASYASPHEELLIIVNDEFEAQLEQNKKTRKLQPRPNKKSSLRLRFVHSSHSQEPPPQKTRSSKILLLSKRLLRRKSSRRSAA